MPPRPAWPAPAPLASQPSDRRRRHTRTSTSNPPRVHRPASATGVWDLTLSPTDGNAANRQVDPEILEPPGQPAHLLHWRRPRSGQAVVRNPERVESRLKSRQLGTEDPALP